MEATIRLAAVASSKCLRVEFRTSLSLGGVTSMRLKTHWSSLPGHGLHAHSQGLCVHLGSEGFAEVHLESGSGMPLNRWSWQVHDSIIRATQKV